MTNAISMTKYSTNVSDSGWKIISKYLNTERMRKYSLREVWNALMYIVKTGCQWRMLPQDFPRWEVVYYYYRKWINEELYDKILEVLDYIKERKLRQFKVGSKLHHLRNQIN